MKNLFLTLFCVITALGVSAQNLPTRDLTDNSGAGLGTRTLSNDTIYLLNGFVFVNDGQTLTIEPGTIIKGKPGTGANASALIIARGGKIIANGTPQQPIIFTAESDDVSNPNDVAPTTQGLWGGLIVLGKASLNTVPGERAIEGIPTSEPRGVYGVPTGGTAVDDDNSGIIRYVSIRHGGTNIGANNEINGLTLGGVGTGTTVEYVEVFGNADDGIEFFGGTVNVKYAIASFCNDDSYDYDLGWRGKGQFWFAIQSDAAGSDRCGEFDGGDIPQTGTPFAIPTIYNATFLGRNVTGSGSQRMMTIRENAGGKFFNSIFMEQGRGVDIEIRGNSDDSYGRFLAGDLKLEKNIFWRIAQNNDTNMITISPIGLTWPTLTDSTNEVNAARDTVRKYFGIAGNVNVDPVLAGIGRTAFANQLDPRASVTGPAYQNIASYPANDPFFSPVSFKGAFGSSPNHWALGWTATDHYGYFVVPPAGTITVTSASIVGKTCWTKNNTYLLDGFVFVEAGDTLCIEAGTVIKGLPGAGADASALIVARGGYIEALGTKDEPIIFTGLIDDVNDPADIAVGTQGLWGGVIILGKAGLNTVPGERAIEGIPVSEPRGLYGVPAGGTAVDDDNSGIFRYVSIRHGGTNIGANNEINGLTLGGVGSRTTIEYVEVFGNADDGIEFFGGTVNVKYAIAAFCNDDSYDYDLGWRGKGQFWFVIQSGDAGSDRCGEFDGGDIPQTGTPFAIPTVYNATFMGRNIGGTGSQRMMTIRENAGGKFFNSLFMEQGRGMDIEIRGNSIDSYDRFVAGDLRLENNVHWDIASNVANNQFTISPIGLTWSSPADSTTAVAAATTAIRNYFAANNVVANPKMISISRAAGSELLDPRCEGNPIYSNLAAYPAGDAFYTPVTYKGAFGPAAADFWAKGWTYMDFLRYFPRTLADTVTSVDFQPVAGLNVYPNPTRGLFTVEASELSAAPVAITVYNTLGAAVRTEVVTPVAGEISHRLDLANLPAAVYVVRIQQGDVASTVRVVKQ